MAKIKFIVDGTEDLPNDYLKANDIAKLPLVVHFPSEEKEYVDGVDITTEKLYELVNEKGELPKTAARSVGDFIEIFDKYLKEGYDYILFFGISSLFSSTIQNALIASSDFEGKVFVHDTMNLSTGEGLQIVKAVKWRNEGDSIETICEKLKELAPKVRSQFVIDSLEYLYKGGRCSGMAFFFGKTLKIHPIIRVVDGKMIVYKKPLGKMKNGLDKLLEIYKEDLPEMDKETVMITQSVAPMSGEYLNAEVSKDIPAQNIMNTNAGCVISSHCGPGTIGILYIVK
jgi:DegV family protein with EDD domain